MRTLTSHEHSKRMSKTNMQRAETISERMREANPMHDPKTRERQRTTLRARGWAPPTRGGNGQPLPVPQRLLACALGWETEVVVPTGRGARKRGLPNNYKIDIANADLMVAIEVDGQSHKAINRQEQDKRKDMFLRGLGWTVLRFTNGQVTGHLEDVVQTVLSTISK